MLRGNPQSNCDSRAVKLATALRSGASFVAFGAMMVATPAFAQGATAQSTPTQAAATDPDSTVEEVVVTGIRASLASAQEIKRNAETFVDSITAEDIGALPDRSVTEALQRIPGIAIDRFAAGVDPDHFSVEGSGVIIRGLTFIRSELNGRDTFTANNGRALSFQDVPAELMGGVDVYKNQTADIIEGGISGTVNLKTRVPFDSAGRTIAASVEANYGDFAERVTPTGSFLVSDRWDTGMGEFGLLANVSYSQLKSRGDGQQISNFGLRGQTAAGNFVLPNDPSAVRQVYLPRGAAFRSQFFDRERLGIGGAAQWRSNDRSMVATLQYLRSEATQAWTEHAVEIATDNVANNGDSRARAGTTVSFDESGIFTRGIITGTPGWRDDQNSADPRTPPFALQSNNQRRDVDQSSMTEDLGFNFKWTPTDRLSLNFDLQRVKSTVEVDDHGLWLSSWQDAEIITNGDEIPTVNFLRPSESICAGTPSSTCSTYLRAPGGLSSPAANFYRAAMDHMEDSEGTLHAARVDLDYKFDEASWIESVRFGARYAERDQTTRFSTYNWGALSEIWGGGGPVWVSDNVDDVRGGTGGSPAGNVEGYAFNNFMRGEVPVPTGAEPRLFYNQSTVENYAAYSAFALRIGDEWRARISPDTGCPQNWVPLALRCDVLAGTPYLPSEVNPMTEKTKSFYGMLRFGHEFENGVNLSGNVGLRWFETERVASGFRRFGRVNLTSDAECARIIAEAAAQVPPRVITGYCALGADVRAQTRQFANGALVANDAELTYDYWLPSFNLKLDLTEGKILRFAYSKGITPPDVGLTRNYYNVNLGLNAEDIVNGRPTARTVVGNPYLRPISAENFDLSAEWYFADVGQLSFSLFYKKIYDAMTNTTERLAFTNNGATFDAVITTPGNSDQVGRIKGFEVAYQQTYDFLPAPFDGLGLNANYTYIDSEGIPQSTLSSTDPDVGAGRVANIDTTLLPQVNLSKHTVNLQAFYDKGPFSARLAYSWRSEFLITVRDVIVPYAPIMNADTGQLDGSVFYTINDNWKVGLQAVNLTNEITKTRQVVGNTPDGELIEAGRSWFMNDRRFTLILRATF
jgi:TonB-dependent receptor